MARNHGFRLFRSVYFWSALIALAITLYGMGWFKPVGVFSFLKRAQDDTKDAATLGNLGTGLMT
jgi:hypothetical protein